jgi:hypothetical protein
VKTSPSIIRINGKQINYASQIEEALNEGSAEGMKVLATPLNTKNKIAIISLWGASGTLLAQFKVEAAAQPSMWKEIFPVFGVFQEIAMITGALATITGLIIMVFKKKLGFTIISTAGLVVLGCFLVPSAVMLVAIIGKMLNSALINAFEHFQEANKGV